MDDDLFLGIKRGREKVGFGTVVKKPKIGTIKIKELLSLLHLMMMFYLGEIVRAETRIIVVIGYLLYHDFLSLSLSLD